MSDINITVDSRQVQTAQQELQELSNSFNNAQKSAGVFEKAFQRAASQMARDMNVFNSVVKANQEIINKNLGVTNSYKSAEQSARAFTEVLRNQERAARQSTAALNQRLGVTGPSAMQSGAGFSAIEGEVERLRMKYDQIYASSQVYERSLNELNRAHMLGVMNTKQHAAAVDALNLEYQQFQAGTATAMNRFNQAQMQSQRGMNQFGMVTQQVGYQVGDFLVQVQSGTNWMVAFGQQATQLAGLLTLIPGMLKIGVALSILIPLATALGAAWMRTSGEGRTFDQVLSDLTQSVTDYRDQVELSLKSTEDLGKLFGSQSNAIRGLAAQMAELRNLKAIEEINKSLDTVAKTLSVTALDVLKGYADNAKGELRKVKDEFDLNDEAAQKLIDTFKQFREAEGVDGAVSAAQDLYTTLLQVFGTADNIPPSLRDAFIQAGLLAQEAAKVEGEFEKVGAAVEDVLRILENITGIDLSGGFDSARSSAEAMNRVLDQTLSKLRGILGAIGSIGFDVIAKRAENAALRAGASAGQARIEGQFAADVAGGPQTGVGGFFNKVGASALKAAREELLKEEEINASLTPTGGGKKGGGVSEVERLRAEYDRLVGSMDPAIRAQQEFNAQAKMLNEALAAGAISGAEFEQALAAIKQKLEEAKDPLRDFKAGLEDALSPEKNYIKGLEALQSSLADFLFNPFEVGLEGMVLGFSRALQRMASEALAAGFMKMLVGGAFGAGGSVGSGIMGFLGFANGGVFSNGNVRAFANGGVVASPTNFPMSGNQVGLMGESGPEAIMPLKRASNGKLGVVADGASGAKSTKIINVLDSRIVGEYLNTPEGEEVIMNVMRRTGVV